ncbi:uncharacterized protein [Montipora capricornis]|uniref:uncharacterized protein isoform X2 n=1 Tax=Montipora capricornis TaxID=246305 RepID=UPI0035F132E2
MNIGPGPFCGSANRTTSSRTLCTCVRLHMVVKFYHPFPSGESSKLNIEIVGKCMVRLQGVVSQRYLVMETNGTLVSKAEPDEEKSIFTYQLQKDFYTFKNGKYFIAFKQGGKLKRVKANESGRNPRKHTRFVLFSNGLSRKRRYPSQLFGADIQ